MQRLRPIAQAASLLAVPVFVALLLALAAPARAQLELGLGWRTISDPSDTISEVRPRIAGNAVTWQRGSGAFSEVMRWDGRQALNLSSNGVADEFPETDGIHIVWQQDNGAQHDIAFHDLLTGTTGVLTSPADEITPLVSGVYLAWVSMLDADGEVFVSPAPESPQITGNLLVEGEFAIEGAYLVWTQADELDLTPLDLNDDLHGIAIWHGDTQELFIVDPPTDDIRPAIAGDVIVWQAGPDESGDIWISDLRGAAIPLYEGTDERNPHTDGTRVIWEHFDGEDLELFVVHLASPNVVTALTSDIGTDDVSPQIQGDDIVWVKNQTPGDSEIWVAWNGGPPTLLPWTRNNGRDDVDPRLDANRFVYESCLNLDQLDELCDVVLVPEPRATLLAGATLALLAGMATRSARRATGRTEPRSR